MKTDPTLKKSMKENRKINGMMPAGLRLGGFGGVMVVEPVGKAADTNCEEIKRGMAYLTEKVNKRIKRICKKLNKESKTVRFRYIIAGGCA